jgi:hypothetical protein
MRIKEILSELSFHGSPCTKDCSGHLAGYNWGKEHPMTPSASPSKSFNNGANISAELSKSDKKVRPKIRDARGKFAPAPQMRSSRGTIK